MMLHNKVTAFLIALIAGSGSGEDTSSSVCGNFENYMDGY